MAEFLDDLSKVYSLLNDECATVSTKIENRMELESLHGLSPSELNDDEIEYINSNFSTREREQPSGAKVILVLLSILTPSIILSFVVSPRAGFGFFLFAQLIMVTLIHISISLSSIDMRSELTFYYSRYKTLCRNESKLKRGALPAQAYADEHESPPVVREFKYRDITSTRDN